MNERNRERKLIEFLTVSDNDHDDFFLFFLFFLV